MIPWKVRTGHIVRPEKLISAELFIQSDLSLNRLLFLNYLLVVDESVLVTAILISEGLCLAEQLFELHPDIIELAARLVLCVLLIADQLFVKKNGWVCLVLQATMQHSRPIVIYEAQSVIVVKYPFILWGDFCVFDLCSLFIDSRVVNSIQEANLDEYSAEEGEIVVVSKADHASQGVLLVLLLMPTYAFSHHSMLV